MSARGWRCAVCAATVDIAEALVWRCPNAADDDRQHALQPVPSPLPLPSQRTGDRNPYLAFRERLAWDGFAAANGLTDDARAVVVAELDARIATVAGTGFIITPFGRANALSDALGFADDGGIWVKDETGNVAGSHKARHLMTVLLHLVTAEHLGLAPWRSDDERPSLAIASCGNAAIAAATLALAVNWPLQVFVPTWANDAVLTRLRALDADVVVCPRNPGDPPGDPCVHRFRQAVDGGAVPFSVQGTENVWCFDGGRTIGWEMAAAPGGCDRVFVQVGGGALAASVAAGLGCGAHRASNRAGAPQLHAVQTASCAPLERAWQRAGALGGPALAAQHWSECMWPWTPVGESAADGILDDETYDWLPVLDAMAATGGTPVVVIEADVIRAHDLARVHTAIPVSPTGSAGLAGLLAIRDEIDQHERIAVIFSGAAADQTM